MRYAISMDGFYLTKQFPFLIANGKVASEIESCANIDEAYTTADIGLAVFVKQRAEKWFKDNRPTWKESWPKIKLEEVKK